MSLTTSLTGALFSMISPTLSMTSSRPAVIFAQLQDRCDEIEDEREHDQHGGHDGDRADWFDGCDEHGLS